MVLVRKLGHAGDRSQYAHPLLRRIEQANKTFFMIGMMVFGLLFMLFAGGVDADEGGKRADKPCPGGP